VEEKRPAISSVDPNSDSAYGAALPRQQLTGEAVDDPIANTGPTRQKRLRLTDTRAKCHVPGMLEHIGRLVGFGMKLGAQRERLRLGPARRYDDADPRPSLGDPMGQVRPTHKSRHAHVREKQPDVCSGFENLEGLVRTFRFEHPVTRIREHVRCPHSFEYIVVDDHNERVSELGIMR
jgi:hypothetical protein